MTRLNSSVDHLTCSLCEKDEILTRNHLFARCGWILDIKVRSLYMVRHVLTIEGSNTKSTMVPKKKMEEVPKGNRHSNLWYYDLSHLASKEHEDFQEHICKYEFCYSTDPKGD